MPPRQRVDVLLPQSQPTPLVLGVDDEERTAAPSGVGVETQLLQPHVVHDPDLGVDVHLAPHRAERGHERPRVAVHAHPGAVEEDFRGRRHDGGGDFFQTLGAPLVEEVLYWGLGAPDGDVSHQGQVLDEPVCFVFWVWGWKGGGGREKKRKKKR